jgi:hypothetical protein
MDLLGIAHVRPGDIEDAEEEVGVEAGVTLGTDLDVQFLGRDHDHRGVAGQGHTTRVLLRGLRRGAEGVDIGGAIRRHDETVGVEVEVGAGGVRAMTRTVTAVALGVGAVVRAVSEGRTCISMCF